MRNYLERLGLYRDVPAGWIAGVCSGMANRLHISPVWLRAGFVLAVVLMHTSMLPVALYFGLAFFMPCPGSQPAGVQTAWTGLRDSVTAPFGPPPGSQLAAAAARFAALEARLVRIEAAVTSGDLKLRQAFRDLGA